MDIEEINKKYKEIRNKYLESYIKDDEIINEAISFFNSYYNLYEHPFTLEDINTISNISFSLKIDFLHWSAIQPKSEKEIINFYRNTPFEFFKNLLKNMDIMHYESIFNLNILPFLNKNNVHTILDYGGGSGYMSLLLEKMKYKTTFSEINKLSIEWMKHIVKKFNYNIDIIDLYDNQIENNYDAIIIKDVIEHILEPEELLSCLNKKTKPLIIIPNKMEKVEDYLPQHFPYILK